MDGNGEIREIRRRIKENQEEISKQYVLMKKALSEAKTVDKQIVKMRIENSELMNRLKILGKRKLDERIGETK